MKPANARRQYVKSTDAPRQPKSPPIDVSELFTAYSAKYGVTYYGKDKAEAEAKMVADDIKRKGKRFIGQSFVSERESL